MAGRYMLNCLCNLFLGIILNVAEVNSMETTANFTNLEGFQFYVFEVEEGILQQEMVIANIPLTRYNVTDYFLFDEPYFKKPNNRKSTPMPAHFEMKFLNITPPDNETTIGPRVRREAVTEGENGSGYEPTTSRDPLTGSSGYTADYSGDGSNSSVKYVESTTPNAESNLNTTWSTTSNATVDYSSGASNSNDSGSNSSVGYVESTTPDPESNLNTTWSTTSSHTSAIVTNAQGTTAQNTNATISPEVVSVTEVTKHTSFWPTSSQLAPTTSHENPNSTSEPMTSTSSYLVPDVNMIAQLHQIYDLDREERDKHFLTINSYSSDGDMLDFPIVVMVKVTDLNDNYPVFDEESLTTQIVKDVKMGEVIMELKATDADIGRNADLRFSILQYSERINDEKSSPSYPTFMINGKLGLVFLFNSLDDLEVPSVITFGVVVKDSGEDVVANRVTATATVSIVSQESTSPTPGPKQAVSTGVAVGVSVVAAILVIAVIVFFAYRYKRKKRSNGDGTLAFMLDDDNLIVA